MLCRRNETERRGRIAKIEGVKRRAGTAASWAKSKSRRGGIFPRCYAPPPDPSLSMSLSRQQPLAPCVLGNARVGFKSARNERRGRDLNPRYPLRYRRFQVVRFKPLSHPSKFAGCGWEPVSCLARKTPLKVLPPGAGPCDRSATPRNRIRDYNTFPSPVRKRRRFSGPVCERMKHARPKAFRRTAGAGGPPAVCPAARISFPGWAPDVWIL